MCYVARREHEMEHSLEFYRDLANTTRSLLELLQCRLRDLELALADRNVSESRHHAAQARSFNLSTSLAESALHNMELLKLQTMSGSQQISGELGQLSMIVQELLQSLLEGSEATFSKVEQVIISCRPLSFETDLQARKSYA